jgi:Cu(I)/Ag(I) efflux system membrane fusion protein
LAAYYTRELRSAVQAYFYVLDRTRSPEAANGPDAGLDRRGLELAIEGLRNLGMSDSQIREIEKTRKAPQYVFLRSPATGFVVGKNITPLQRFNHGDELYRIADLRRVWILADLFQSETRFVQAAAPAHIILQHSSRIIQAKVSGTLPQFDEASRTLKVRIEVDNPGFTLKPDMFVDVEFPVRLPAGLTVPEDAVINSGQVKTVFIDMGGGRFEPRTVETGWRFGDRVQIVRGVAAGEKIVISGNFLMDSEVRMRREVTGMSGPQ